MRQGWTILLDSQTPDTVFIRNNCHSRCFRLESIRMFSVTIQESFMTTVSHPYERIDLRTSPEIKELIVRAAATAGVSLSAFLIASAKERAKQVLAERSEEH